MDKQGERKELLLKHRKVRIKTSTGDLYLLAAKNRFAYEVNGITVGITEKMLDSIIAKLSKDTVLTIVKK